MSLCTAEVRLGCKDQEEKVSFTNERERETKRREGDRERRTIKENSKDKKKYFLSMSNTVTEMVFYYKSPFTSYVLIISIL